VRAKAYEEITDMFKNASRPTDDCFRDHCGSWKKYLSDSIPAAQEKSLDALLAFIDKGDSKIVASTQNELIRTLIDKCLS
jgi:hypothetical protein